MPSTKPRGFGPGRELLLKTLFILPGIRVVVALPEERPVPPHRLVWTPDGGLLVVQTIRAGNDCGCPVRATRTPAINVKPET